MTDTSKEAVESFIKTELTEIARSTGLLVSEEDVEACKEAAKIMRALLTERDALRAQLQAARDEALEEAAQVVCNDEVHPGMPYDDYGNMIADTSERHAQNVAKLMLWNLAAEIRALKSTSAEGEG